MDINGITNTHASPPPAVPVAPASPAPVAAQPSPAANEAQFRHAVGAIARTVAAVVNTIEFSVDKESGKNILKIVDGANGLLIRQIPSEEVMEIAKALDRLQGLLLKQQA